MRKQFVKTLIELAEQDDKILLLTGDLGFSFLEPFQEKFPNRYINVGIAEQNLIGVASGLAMSGFKPYCYSVSSILLCRAYEQIRNMVCYQNRNVKIIGTSSGNFLGFTHNFEGTENEEDLLKNLPNMERYYPPSVEALRFCLKISYKHNSPSFIRL